MPVSDGFYSKQTAINFTVKNISPQQKTIRVFNYPMAYGASRDLMAIPEISEDDIRNSLIKGELADKIRNGSLTIVSSTIDLLQLDASQSAFLINNGYLPSLANIPAVTSNTVLAGDSRTVYVSKAGNDTTGDGSFLMPFASISHALSQMTDSSQVRPHQIQVGPGEYTEDILIRPWIGIVGVPATSGFEGLTTVTVNSVTFDPRWFGNTYNVAWFSHITFNNAPTFDFSIQSSLNGQLTFFDCLFNSGVTYIGDQSGNVNNVVWDDCLSYGLVSVRDCQYFFMTGGSLIQITGGG